MSIECDEILSSVRGAHTWNNQKQKNDSIVISLQLKRNTHLHGHQQCAIQWMLEREFVKEGLKGGILADGPGLGKTLTMLSVIQLHTSSSPTLVVVPNQIIAQQWLKDMSTHFKANAWNATIFSASSPIDPTLHVVLILMKDLTKEWHRRQSELSERGRSVSTLYHIPWSRICVDEVQEILGKTSLAAQMIQQLEAPIRWGLSGTPVSKIADIAGVAQFLQMAPYDSAQWWRDNSLNAQTLVQPLLDEIVWRTPNEHVVQSLQLPSQTILPTKYVQMSAIEYAAYRPQFERYVKEVHKRIASFQGNHKQIVLSELRQVMNHPAVLSLCKGATHVSLLTKNKTSASLFLAHMGTRQREQCSIALAQLLETCLHHPSQLQDAYILWQKYRSQVTIPWLVQLKVFSALADYTVSAPPIKYRHEIHRAAFDTKHPRLPLILWQRVMEYLRDDFTCQRSILLREHQVPLKTTFDVMAARFWHEHGNESLEEFQNQIEASYHLENRLPQPALQSILNDFMEMRLTEAKSRVGTFERPTLWHYLRNKKCSTVDPAEIRMVTIDLLTQYIEQYSASVKLLHDLMHANWHEQLGPVLEGYNRCNHATRRLDRTLVVGREERWQRRDQENSAGRGQISLGSRCVVCALRNRIDLAMSFLQTEGKTPTLMVYFFTTDAPTEIQNLFRQSVSTLQQMQNLATLLDSWLRVSSDVLSCMTAPTRTQTNILALRRVDLALARFQVANYYRLYTNAISAMDQVENATCDACQAMVPRLDIRLLLCCHRFCSACCIPSNECLVCKATMPFSMTKAPPLPPHLLLCGSKMDMILNDLRAIAPQEKCVVFSQYPEVLDLLVQHLQEIPLPCVQLRSGNQSELRQKFQTHANLRVLLLPLKKYNHGLNLVEATHVFLLEPSLQPALHAQAMARVKRLNQTRPTFVHRYVMRDTVEEAIEAVVSQHRRLTKMDIFRIFAADEMRFY